MSVSKKSHRYCLAAALALLLLFSAGCVGSRSSEGTVCTSNSDCPTNQACALSRCVPVLGDATNVVDVGGNDTNVDSGPGDTGGEDQAKDTADGDQVKDSGGEDQVSDQQDQQQDDQIDDQQGDQIDGQQGDQIDDQQDLWTPDSMDAQDTVVPTLTISKLNIGNALFKITPDSKTLVFLADLNADGQRQLYTMPLAGPHVPKLLADASSSNKLLEITNFHVGPKGEYVAFRGDLKTDQVFDMWIVPLAGGTPKKISPTATVGQVTHPMATVSNSGVLIFNGDYTTDGLQEIWAGPIDGSTEPIKISIDDQSAEWFLHANSWKLSPDGNYLVFRGRPGGNATQQLMSYNFTTKKLKSISNAYKTLGMFQIDAEGKKVYFVARDGILIDSPDRLFVNDITGGTSPVVISPTTNSTHSVTTFQVGPLGKVVAYVGKKDIGTATVQMVSEVYLTNSTGSARTLVSYKAEDTFKYIDIRFTDDGSHIVYKSDMDQSGSIRLYSVALAEPSKVIELSPNKGTGLDVEQYAFAGLKQEMVVFTGDMEQDDVKAVYRVAVGGGAEAKLFSDPVSKELNWITGLLVSPNGNLVFYGGDLDVDGELYYYVKQMGSGNLVTPWDNPDKKTDQSAEQIEYSPDSKFLVFTILNEDDPGVITLPYLIIVGFP